MNEISPMSASKPSSNSSLQDVVSSQPTSTVSTPSSNGEQPAQLDEDFLTAPLVGLCPKPVDQMTDEELRLHVMQVQQYRQSFQTFKAEVEQAEVENVRVKKQRASKITSSDIDILLE